MKFNEKLLKIRKERGLSQEELGMELQVSRQTISKWDTGQSYPDFTRLVMLSDFFDMTLDELVKDIDVQEIRNKNFTDEKVDSLYKDSQIIKDMTKWICKFFIYAFIFAGIIAAAAFILHSVFPESEIFFRRY